ncbi:hypothetical protein BC940DRAFT_307114 [Gongronella butleri]|nr:hypothetical protein BC940DRAFT_307114 [Gongronella butleri]
MSSSMDSERRGSYDPTTLTSSLPLLPFQNQVGGHCSFFRFSKRAICKPMSHKERQFYEHLDQHHTALLPFISQYLGVVNVTYRSSNAQPMLPEVILADNPHLLVSWKRDRQPTRRRRTVSTNNTNNKPLHADDEQRPALSPRSFKEQVLREVFSPEALQERLQQVRDWQQGMRLRQLEQYQGNTPPPPCLHPSRSVLDLRPKESPSSPSSSNPSAPLPVAMATDASRQPIKSLSSSLDTSTAGMRRASIPATHQPPFGMLVSSYAPQRLPATPDDVLPQSAPAAPEGNAANCQSPSSPQIIVHPRQPTIIGTTTSAPQTPRMRETKLHNPSIRPFPGLSTSEITNHVANESPMVQPSSENDAPPSPLLSHSPLSLSSPPMPPVATDMMTPEDDIVPVSLDTRTMDDSEVVDDKRAKMPPRTASSSAMSDGNASSSASSASWRPRRAPTNPWSEQMYRRDLEKVNVDDVQQFILIEDLTDGVQYPCVLDLKMGTRQHSVYATPAKYLSQTNKCKRSTSAAMGVRVSGMQVYSLKQGRFLFEDKYHGRTLTPDTFRDTLVHYFDNGNGAHIRHLPALIRKLTLIYRIIQSMDSYRFYASSLLIIYDAAPTNKRQIDVRLIDFAKSVTKQEWLDQHTLFTYPPDEHPWPQHADSIGPDEGYLLGLRSLIACFSWIYTSHGGDPNDLVQLTDDKE